jgi:hypothetical protein
MKDKRLPLFASAVLLFAVLFIPAIAHAQAASMVGTLDNFDVLNNTGEDTHGFEIELEGVQKEDIYRIFGNWSGTNVIRYGAGEAVNFPGGVYIRWKSPWDPAAQRFTLATPVPLNRSTVPGESCWTLGMGDAYYSAGCEHFGISAYKNPIKTTYRWLIADPQNPGQLIPSQVSVSLPVPTWSVAPAVGGNPVVVAAEIDAPEAAEPVLQYGDAQWVKVYKAENPAEVQLEDLVGDNPAVVPRNAGQVEVEWNLLQQEPIGEGRQRRKGRQVNAGNLGAGAHAVVRRYEYYEYAGAYDPVTHQALCGGDGTCNAPLDGEIGNAIGVQNAAANINAPSLTVTTSGNGSVSSSDKIISCGNRCFSYYAGGTSVTLTVKAGSNNSFTGWTGACTGSELSCTLPITDALTVTATFAADPRAGGGGGGGGAAGGGGGGGGGAATQATLSVKTVGGKGAVTSAPAGINCGKVCTASVSAGTTLTLSVAPEAGFVFTGWSGACTGNGPCRVTLNASISVQANFAKQ